MKFNLTFSALKWRDGKKFFPSFVEQSTVANDVEEIKEKYQVLRMQRVWQHGRGSHQPAGHRLGKFLLGEEVS